MSRRRLAGPLLALFALASAGPLWALPETGAIRAILEQRIDRDQQSVGLVVGLIDENGTRVVAHGKTARDGRPVDGGTLFEIGSVTKVFTAILLADMVDKGQVALDDPLAKLLPETVTLPTRGGKSITLLHLATHTSGLPRMPSNFEARDPANPYADYTVERMYAFLAGYELTRDTGAEAEYSNLGVGLLGHALARRAGEDYETLVRKRIVLPLGMRDTVITLTRELGDRMATGHSPGLDPVPAWDLPTLAGAGALRSTADDMLKFLAANLGLSAGGPEKAILSTHAPRHEFGPEMQVGLGWLIRQGGEREIVWHNGGTGGFHSFVGFDKEAGAGVVVLSNSATDIDDIGMHLLDPALPLAKLEPPPATAAIDPAAFDAWTGRYQLAPGFVIEVTREEGRFYVQATGQPKIEIFPESEMRFFARAVEAKFSFVRDASGAPDHLVLHQGGLDQKAKRTTGEGPAEFGTGTTVVLAPELLERYVGRYELAPGFVLTVTRDGAQLAAQATGQPAVEIYPASETEFFYKVVDARITFTVDAAGAVSGLTLHQGGREMPARRRGD